METLYQNAEYAVHQECTLQGVNIHELPVDMASLDANPRYRDALGCNGCLTDNTAATKKQASYCLSCG
jgi:hypothetical protein